MRRSIPALIAIVSVAVAGQSTNREAPAAAPVPEQIAKARTVFMSNDGADPALQLFSGGDNRPYNSFYAAMKSWGRYELTPAPAGSDLVFQLRFVNRPTYDGTLTRSDPQLVLTIRDPSTRVVLWRLTVHVKQKAGLQATRDKSFEEAITSLVNDVKALAATQ